MFAGEKYVKQTKNMYITTLIDFSLKNSEKVFHVKNMITYNIVWQQPALHVHLNQKLFKHLNYLYNFYIIIQCTPYTIW